MQIIGLTGGSGSGKGVVSKTFAALGAYCIDTDALYHAIISQPSPCVEELKERFGADILTEEGAVCRPLLAAKVFCGGAEEKVRLASLNDITHRHILAETRRLLRLEAEKGRIAAVVDAPLLFESRFHTECDVTLAVLAPRAVRLTRIIERDGLAASAAEARLAAQPTDDFYQTQADFCIVNDGSLDDLIEKATLFWHQNIIKSQP